MNDNLLQVFAATGMTAAHAYQLARNSFEASFCDAAQKRRFLELVDACFATFR